MELSSWWLLGMVMKFLLVASPRPHARIPFIAGEIPEDQESKKPQVCANHICRLRSLASSPCITQAVGVFSLLVRMTR